MVKRFVHISFLILLAIKGYSQKLYDDQQKFDLMSAGKSKVKVFANGRLKFIWHIDSSAKRIEIHTLGPTEINAAPKYNDKLSTSQLKKYCFNQHGMIDSITIIDYQLLMTMENAAKVDTIPDITIIIYTYPLLEKQAINRKRYSVKNGQKIKLGTDYFGYDAQKRLVLQIQDEGRVQYFYSYNAKGQIEKETVLGTTIIYSYNETGQLESRISDSQNITYEYNEAHPLIRKTVSGNHAEILTYEYE
jgi:YD repeat-containing protein